MIFSIHGVSLRDVATTPQEAVEIAKNAGFKHIEIPLMTWKINPETVAKNDIAEIRNILRSAGVEASSIGGIWPEKYLMITHSTAEWIRNVNYVKKVFELSEALKINRINLGGPKGRSVPIKTPYYKGLEMFVKFWKEACEYAERARVIVGMEHIVRSHTNVGNTTKQLMDLVQAVNSPSFQINAQIHHMAYEEHDLESAIIASGEMIKLVHIADIGGYNPIIDPVEFLIPGRGKLNFISVFRAFKKIGYDGEICMEPSPSKVKVSEDYVSELREGRKFLEAKWKEA